MFFPKAMTEVELIVPSKDLLAVAKVLSGRGVFHQIDSTYLGLENLGPSNWQDKAATYSALERRIQVIMQAVNLEEVYSGSSDFDSLVDYETVNTAVERIEEDVKKTSDQQSAEKKRLEQLESQLHQLEPIADINVEVGALRKSAYLHSVLGIIPAANMGRLETSLSRVPHVFFNLRDDSQKPVVWLLGPRSNSDIIDRAAKSAYLNPLVLPDEFDGTPAQIATSIHKAIENSKQKISELNNSLSKLANTHRKELNQLLWEVHVSRLMADAIARFGQLRHTYVVVGWVPSADLNLLTERLKQASREILIEAIPSDRSGHNTNVPVALTDNKWLKPIQNLVTTFGRPSYGELDPTILMAFSFPILYGAMFGDVGQGLVLMLVGYLAHNRIFMKGLQSLGLLLVYSGFFATVFGFLYGSIFGFEGHLVEEYLHFHFEPLWLSPLENILTILGFAIEDRKSTRLNSSHGYISYAVSLDLHSFPTRRSSDLFMKGLQSLGLLLVYSGFFATVFGFLYGSIFGFEGHLVEEYLHFHFEPLWLSPLENILTILGFAIDAGIIILLFGYLLGLFNNIRTKDWAHF